MTAYVVWYIEKSRFKMTGTKQKKKYISDLFSSYKYTLDFDHCICV